MYLVVVSLLGRLYKLKQHLQHSHTFTLLWWPSSTPRLDFSSLLCFYGQQLNLVANFVASEQVKNDGWVNETDLTIIVFHLTMGHLEMITIAHKV